MPSIPLSSKLTPYFYTVLALSMLINIVPLCINLLLRLQNTSLLAISPIILLSDLINLVLVIVLLQYFIQRRPWAYYCVYALHLSNQIFFILVSQILTLSVLQTYWIKLLFVLNILCVILLSLHQVRTCIQWRLTGHTLCTGFQHALVHASQAKLMLHQL